MPADGDIRHGGDLDEARRTFPDAPEPWIDLSTGINPVAYRVPPIPPHVFRRLPASSELARLEGVAAAAYGCRPGEIVAAPGTQALIELLPRLRPPSHVAVVGPTYAEHAKCWRKAGHSVVSVASPGEDLRADVVVVVNPNNPDGRSWSRPGLTRAAARLADQGGLLVVDEAFADLEEVESLAPERPDGVAVLRSFGKTYGLAGLRLGFLVADPGLIERMRHALGPWAVSGPALAIGQAALADRAWGAQASRDRLRDAARLDALLSPAVDRVVGGTRLFRCYESGRAAALFGQLGRRGIWVRRFQDAPNRLRLGLPGDEVEWTRLAEALG